MQAPHQRRVLLAQQLTTDSLDTGLGGRGGEGEGRHRASKGTTWGRASTHGIRAPSFSRPEFPTRVLRGKGTFPGGAAAPALVSRPAKVPVVRVLCRYKLGVRPGRVLLHISLAHSSRRGLSPASLQLTPANVAVGVVAHGPGSPPATRGAIGSWWGAPLLTGTLSARHSHLPCSRARPGSLRRSTAAPAARTRGDAGTLRTARHPPGVAQRQHGPAAPGRVRVPAQATGLVPRSLSPPALPSSRPLPQPGGAPGGTLRPGTEQATRWRPPIAPSLHRDVSSLGGYL